MRPRLWRLDWSVVSIASEFNLQDDLIFSYQPS